MATAQEWFLNAFNKNSAIRRPLGSGATYGGDSHPIRSAWASIIPANNGAGGTAGTINQGHPFGLQTLMLDGAAPLRTMRHRNADDTAKPSTFWGFSDPVSLHIPDANTINQLAGDRARENHVALGAHDQARSYEFYQTNRKAGPEYYASIGRSVPTDGLGHGTAVGQRVGNTATGTSILFGALLLEELFGDGPIGHALKLATYAGRSGAPEILSRDIQYPATNTDGFASSADNNNGPVPYGQLMAILPSVNLGSIGLTTDAGMKLAAAFQDYGAYVMDEANNACIIRCNGSLGAEAAAIISDYRRCIRLLYPVTNSAIGATAQMNIGGGYSGSVGTLNADDNGGPIGGGTPRAANTAFDAGTPPPSEAAMPTLLNVAAFGLEETPVDVPSDPKYVPLVITGTPVLPGDN